jgi:hypothetical protein
MKRSDVQRGIEPVYQSAGAERREGGLCADPTATARATQEARSRCFARSNSTFQKKEAKSINTYV